MRVQYASYSVPIHPGSSEEEELNRFLRGHRVIQTWNRLIENDRGASWVFLVEYFADQKTEAPGRSQARIDYKEILSPDDFSLFSKLRELRKATAESQGLPVYAVFTNDQLAEMARIRPVNSADLQKVAGIGAGKADRFGQTFLGIITGVVDAADGTAF